MTRASWWSLAVVAPGSLAFLAATVMWVSGHDPRAAVVPTDATGPTAAAASTTISSPAGVPDDAMAGQDTATSLRLAQLQVLLGQAEAQLQLLDQGAAVAAQAPAPADVLPPVADGSPAVVDVSPPVAEVQPSIAPPPAPAAHAVTGASGA